MTLLLFCGTFQIFPLNKITTNSSFQLRLQLLFLYSMAKYFHHRSVHISSTGGLSFAPAGQLKSLANSTRLLRGTLTRHGEGLCPLRLCGREVVSLKSVKWSYHSRFKQLLVCWLVFNGTPVHCKCNLKLCIKIVGLRNILLYPKQLVGGEWEVWKTYLLLFPPEMLQGIVGKP